MNVGIKDLFRRKFSRFRSFIPQQNKSNKQAAVDEYFSSIGHEKNGLEKERGFQPQGMNASFYK
jgi:hypothetical protein